MKVIHEEGRHPIHLWSDGIEDGALAQLKNVATLPFLHPHGVAAMPDVHWGIGATVGSVIATQGAIIPAAVGVDIGCGMNAVRTNLVASNLPDSLAELRHSIERGVPLGTGGRQAGTGSLTPCWKAWIRTNVVDSSLHSRYIALTGKHPKLQTRNNPASQLGTLGSGNHFIEVCLDEEQRVWLMLHSGSRGVGNLIGRHFIEKAKLAMEKYFITLPDKDLAYLADDTQDHRDYVEAVLWAQDYAAYNRLVMMAEVFRCLKHALPQAEITDEAISCHHNYVERETHFGKTCWLTRKGAIRARSGDLGIIPGSMGTKSYIVRGLGNPASYHSCSHGAGRMYGRKAARERFTVEDLRLQTEGVECRKDDAVLDELPSAYKDIDKVMEDQKDLVEVVHTLKQVLCVKGD